MRTFFFCYCLMERRSRCELILKKEAPLSKNLLAIAEREGFEPPVPLGTAVFKTAVIDHSTTFPWCDLGGARTLDPMIKSHLLYQLSYQVIFSAIEFFFQTSVCFSIAVAKVGFIFNLTNF